MAVCDVCRLVDGDSRMKLCQYCSKCAAWICQADLGNWRRRAVAMMKRRWGR